jgi:hypothetical protein
MQVMFADYGPGGLTGIYLLMLGGLGVAFCLALAGVLALGKERRVARGFLIAGGVVFVLAIFFVCLARGFGERFHLP